MDEKEGLSSREGHNIHETWTLDVNYVMSTTTEAVCELHLVSTLYAKKYRGLLEDLEFVGRGPPARIEELF